MQRPQQRTARNRRVKNPYQWNAQRQLLWEFYVLTGNQLTIQLISSVGALSSNGVLQLRNLSTGEYPLSMSFAGSQVSLIYPTEPPLPSIFELEGGDSALRGSFGEVLAPARFTVRGEPQDMQVLSARYSVGASRLYVASQEFDTGTRFLTLVALNALTGEVFQAVESFIADGSETEIDIGFALGGASYAWMAASSNPAVYRALGTPAAVEILV